MGGGHSYKAGRLLASSGCAVAGVAHLRHAQPFSSLEQRQYALGDVVLRQGDVLRTTCTFENTTSNTITFGEGSDDEMCINWVMTYPAGAMNCAIQR